LLEAELDAWSPRLEGWLAADQSSPSERAERQEEAQREGLVLQHWHDWSVAQIAEHLGRSRAAVAGLIQRGSQQLRRDLGPPE
jgi:RNA polymerase sigma-70 factor (ECF subfamily)